MAMIAAGFTGGEAEELRRAFGFKRSEKRMADIEVKLRAGMDRNGITARRKMQSSTPSRHSLCMVFPNRTRPALH
jgi:DNA polymerase III alpha subunit